MAESTPNTATIDCNLLVAKALARAGVTHMFGVVGIPVTSLATRAVTLGIRFIAFHNEQSAGYAASAYGYLTGRPGVLLTVSGPGCVHGLAGLSNAAVNCWPTVMISGSCDQNDVGKGDFQELDQIAAVKPFVKFSVKAKNINEIPNCVFSVLDHAGSGRPGGCYLDIPSDVLHQTLTELEANKLLDDAEKNRYIEPVKSVSNDDIAKAISAIRKAERPLIVFGKGAAIARAENEIKDLVEKTGIPFLPTPMGKGLLPDTHELAATAARSLAIGKCDVAIVVGARLNWLLHFGEPPKWSKDVKFILIDVDEGEIEFRKPYLGLVGDAKKVLKVLNKEIKDDPFCLGRTHPWIEAITNKVKENVSRMEGDSGFGFSAMEVETLVRYQLPVVVIVFNNGGVYGGDRRNPEDITGPYKDDPAPTSFVPGAAYHLLIEAFGGKGYLVGTPDELKSALTESFSARKPAVINVTIDPYAGAESGRMQHKN
ncbi:putative indole-3-pyruvate decarboxylase, Entero, DHS-like NAD/FAD-binding domain superfamily [Helianthus annuus]|uniref:2-hydroxyacyl-CoA lyase n=1 Tax=Helianthus annuus TaxID=4232 RepID=A0A9K3IKK8_HELAN|nr:putative indole-3-pyruvate decarboxylase, Entero, DHS-like NAD/FAD-binding domain superfamily [Helianthus annuus]KAJ0904831.1 hypothetical protein HanPSC8_Chr07g0286891 [Helianthus annuus]